MRIASKRVVLLHGHMFKNAGSSVDTILSQNFGEGFVAHTDDVNMREGGQAYLETYLHQHQHLRALSSHWLPMPLHSTPELDLRTFVMLRDPIVRVASVYRFEKRQKADTLGAIAAKKYQMRDYIRWRLDEQPGVISNYFTEYLTSTLDLDLLDRERALEEARRTLKQVYFVGIVEAFEDSMRSLKARLSSDFSELEVSNIRANTTDSRILTNEQRKQEISGELGDALYKRLLSANQIDIDLYQQVRDRFKSGIRASMAADQ